MNKSYDLGYFVTEVKNPKKIKLNSRDLLYLKHYKIHYKFSPKHGRNTNVFKEVGIAIKLEQISNGNFKAFVAVPSTDYNIIKDLKIFMDRDKYGRPYLHSKTNIVTTSNIDIVEASLYDDINSEVL